MPVDDELDPDVLLAAVIEAVAENLPGDDADVIELSERAQVLEPDDNEPGTVSSR